jgi:molybdenum cofactor guanylyltransferase
MVKYYRRYILESGNHTEVDLSCIILAGGKGARLGRNKITVDIGGRTLLQRVIDALAFFNTEIILVTAREEPLPDTISYPQLRMAADIYQGKGSLGGIYTGLVASESYHNLVVACDMPLLNTDLLSYMIKVSGEFDLVVPSLENKIEPLHAIYSKGCIKPIEHMFKCDELQIFQFYQDVRVRYLETQEIDRLDPCHLSFFNINTEADLKRAEELIKEKGYSRC